MSAATSIRPAKIASLLASATEIVYALGLGDHVVAVSHECDYPPEATAKPRVTYSLVDAAQSSQAIDDQVHQRIADGQPLYGIRDGLIRELAPDLIVTQAQCDVCAVKYEDVMDLVKTSGPLAETQVVALNPTSLDDIFRDILRVGEAAGHADGAGQFVASLRARMEAVRAKTLQLAVAHRPRVACIEWIEPLMLAANWVPRLVELAGGENGLTAGDRHSTYSDWDGLIRYDPQVIVIMPCGFDLLRTIQEAQGLPKRRGWNRLSAVRNGRVYAVDGNAYFNRSGPRIVDSLEMLAAMLHPRLFADQFERAAGFTRLPAK